MSSRARIRKRRSKPQRLLVVASTLVVLSPVVSLADGIKGFAELGYSQSNSEVSGGERTLKQEGSSFLQRYQLGVDRSITPILRLTLGGNFERADSSSSAEGVDRDSTMTRKSPFIDLALTNQLYTAGVGYTRREEASSSGGFDSTNTLETYTAKLGMRPEGLPTLDALFSHSAAFDEDRAGQDRETDSFLIGSRYSFKGMDLGYQGNFTQNTDNISGMTTETTNHTGRVSWSGRFLEQRLMVSFNDNISYQETTGEVLVPSFLTPGLFVASNTISPITLATEGKFSDGSLVDGVPVELRKTVNGQMGLSFLDQTTISAFFVATDKRPEAGVPATAVPILWNVYISNDNNTWILHAAEIEADYVITGGIGISGRFEIFFTPVTARYVKVVPVINPLSLVVSAPMVVTEIQAVQTGGVGGAQAFEKESRSSVLISNYFDANAKYRILAIPLLIYDVSFQHNYTGGDADTMTRYQITNGLGLSHRFNEILSGSARVTREDIVEEAGNRSGFTYSASLSAQPLPTLSHTLVYSGRMDSNPDGEFTSNSIFMTNSADLYKGVSLSLAGGYSRSTNEDDRLAQSTNLTFGANLVPNERLTINASFSSSESWQSGGDLPDAETSSMGGEISAAWNPVRAIYLYGTIGIQEQDDLGMDTTWSAGGSWSPFRDGDLQMSLAYSENSLGDQTNRSFNQSIRWNIRPGWYWDVSFQMSQSELARVTTDTQNISTTLRMAF